MLLDVTTRNPIAEFQPDFMLAPPGSTAKPFALTALIRAHKLTEQESYPCEGKLTIAGRQFNCSHPRLAEPMRVQTAIAYSCNCFVAHMAQRFAPGELANTLAQAEFHHGVRVAEGDTARLQALGEDSLLVTAADLAQAYRWLALNAAPAVARGLEDAVEYGTGQFAHVEGANVAGKTGTVMARGGRIVWFAGYFPSREPKVSIAVMVSGASGGSDAAPIAGRILTAYRDGSQ
jgi:cell division protein FtsI/penicillin-binding protein 2